MRNIPLLHVYIETEMDFPIFSIAYKGSYRPLFTLVIVFFILANELHTLSFRKSECTIIIIVMLLD